MVTKVSTACVVEPVETDVLVYLRAELHSAIWAIHQVQQEQQAQRAQLASVQQQIAEMRQQLQEMARPGRLAVYGSFVNYWVAVEVATPLGSFNIRCYAPITVISLATADRKLASERAMVRL
eukprot:m51a1_g234 hypothetical protein (122) ;mRNA; f:120213-121366